MKREKMLSGAFNSIVIIIIITILTAAVFLLYRTIQKSAEADIFRYTKELEDSVHHTAGAEYSRFLFFIELGKSVGNSETLDHLSVRLESLEEIFGPQGEMPNLVLSTGYFYADNPEKAFEYNFSTDKWTETDGVFSKKNINRDWEYYYTGTDYLSGNLYLVIREAEWPFAVFFSLDRLGFIENYVKEIIISTNDEFKLEWIRIEDPESRRNFEKETRGIFTPYKFQPLRIITGTLSNKQPLIVGIPGLFDAGRYFIRNDSGNDASRSEKPDRPAPFDSGFFVKMSREDGSYYHDIEYRAAVGFFETVVIFIVIGILFILLLFQLQRTRVLRRKEKEFVASITHELRTPLTVIRSAADNLITGIVSKDKLPVYGNLIIGQSERLGNMIEEILLYSKFEDKKMKQDLPVKMELQDIISDLKQPLEALSASCGSRLKWDIKGLPESVSGYPEIVTLAVNNLVTNAINHAYTDHAGEIRITVRTLIPDKMQIIVEDDGRGIEPRELKHIFEPFYRDSTSRQRQEKGSGLGLFIIRRKAMLAGGRLTVESPYRRIDGSKLKGCRFTLTLPCLLKESFVG